jgi:hypothetical protein
MADTRRIYTIADDLTVWIGEGDGSIHIKTREPHGDPVELNEHQAEKLIETLTMLLAEIR